MRTLDARISLAAAHSASQVIEFLLTATTGIFVNRHDQVPFQRRSLHTNYAISQPGGNTLFPDMVRSGRMKIRAVVQATRSLGPVLGRHS